MIFSYDLSTTQDEKISILEKSVKDHQGESFMLLREFAVPTKRTGDFCPPVDDAYFQIEAGIIDGEIANQKEKYLSYSFELPSKGMTFPGEEKIANIIGSLLVPVLRKISIIKEVPYGSITNPLTGEKFGTSEYQENIRSGNILIGPMDFRVKSFSRIYFDYIESSIFSFGEEEIKLLMDKKRINECNQILTCLRQEPSSSYQQGLKRIYSARIDKMARLNSFGIPSEQ